MIHIKLFQFNSFGAHCIILWDDGKRAVIVDPGYGRQDEKILFHSFIRDNGLKPEKILLTHCHIDHVLGLADCCRTYGLKATFHSSDLFQLEDENVRQAGLLGFSYPAPEGIEYEFINDGDIISAGEITLEVIHTPGHTPGGVCYLCRDEKLLLSGDTLFAGAIGRTDIKGGDYDALMKSIMNGLMTLDGDIDVLPGHGNMTSIARERQTNPFLEPFNEPLDEDAEI